MLLQGEGLDGRSKVMMNLMWGGGDGWGAGTVSSDCKGDLSFPCLASMLARNDDGWGRAASDRRYFS